MEADSEDTVLNFTVAAPPNEAKTRQVNLQIFAKRALQISQGCTPLQREFTALLRDQEVEHESIDFFWGAVGRLSGDTLWGFFLGVRAIVYMTRSGHVLTFKQFFDNFARLGKRQQGV